MATSVKPATIALILGASSFPSYPELEDNVAFENSARGFADYLRAKDGLQIPKTKILNLFDSPLHPGDMLGKISSFLEKHTAWPSNLKRPPVDCLIFYCGHGDFSARSQQFLLAIKKTNRTSTSATCIRIDDLAEVIRLHGNRLRIYLVLDCCFAAAASSSFQSASLETASLQAQSAFVQRGVALLCSSSAKDVSIADPGSQYTRFSGALLSVLRNGVAELPEMISLAQIAQEVRNRIKGPEIHSPDQAEGKIADHKFFPNRASLGKLRQQELLRRIEQNIARPSSLLSESARRKHGLSLREAVCFEDQQRTSVFSSDSRIRMDLLFSYHAGGSRLKGLIDLRIQRMVDSPQSYFSEASALTAADFRTLPAMGLEAQLFCRAELSSLGCRALSEAAYAITMLRLDHTVRGPWEWDVKRAAVSLVLTCISLGYGKQKRAQVVKHFARWYAEYIHELSRKSTLELGAHSATMSTKKLGGMRNYIIADSLTLMHSLIDPRLGRFKNTPPLLTRVVPSEIARITQAMAGYMASLPRSTIRELDTLRLEDVAFQAVGTGSVGLRDYLLYLKGKSASDVLFLQLREQSPSPWRNPKIDVKDNRELLDATLEGERLLQPVGDRFTGSTELDGRPYIVRQLLQTSGQKEIREISEKELKRLSRVLAEVIGLGHARTLDPCVLSAYLGTDEGFDLAISNFAESYAQQVAEDHFAFAARSRKK